MRRSGAIQLILLIFSMRTLVVWILLPGHSSSQIMYCKKATIRNSVQIVMQALTVVKEKNSKKVHSLLKIFALTLLLTVSQPRHPENRNTWRTWSTDISNTRLLFCFLAFPRPTFTR